MNEAQVRRDLIDPALRVAGWEALPAKVAGKNYRAGEAQARKYAAALGVRLRDEWLAGLLHGLRARHRFDGRTGRLPDARPRVELLFRHPALALRGVGGGVLLTHFFANDINEGKK